ncbi:MAG: hypothetical protein C0506_02460 [Anaerolinea sp.]|nr:hypothetical protein [Anaerolinea sp.]
MATEAVTLDYASGMIKLMLMRLLRPVVGRFPRVFYRVASFAGWFAFQTRRGLRRQAVRNMLPLCDGDLPRAKREALRATQRVAQYYVDLATLPRRNMAKFEAEHLSIDRPDRLAMLEEPGPIVVVSAHTGNAELAIQALTYRGRDFVALVEALRPRQLADYVGSLRSSGGGNFHEAGFAGLRSCLAALKQGQLVGVMGDRDIQGTGLCLELAGRWVKLPRGPWELARRSGAPVLPVFCTRVRNDDFKVNVEEPILVRHTEDADADVQLAAEQFARILETHLRQDPGQWFVLEDFWRVHACREHDGEHDDG